MPTVNHRKLYYDRAYATAAETDYFLELAHDLHYINDPEYDLLLNHVRHASALVYRLAASCSNKK